jgi:hypothetical protein
LDGGSGLLVVVGRTFGRGKDQAREEEGAWCHLMWQFGFTAVP